jgi:hypothetical protein
MIEMPQEPVPQYPDPADPHDQCERDIEAAKRAPRAVSLLELHGLVGALLPGQTYIIDITVHHSVSTYGPPSNTVHWRVAYGFDEAHRGCKQLEAESAAALYEKLRAALPPHPLDEVGELPW